jgi:hypothetical protein
MGIEPTRAPLPGLANKRFGATSHRQCDWRVNIYGMWGSVGIHRCARSRAPALQSQVSDGA